MKYVTLRKIDNYLYEIDSARRNPEQNRKISVKEYLEPFKDDPNYFISFTDVNKIGLNPSTDYDTPLGIYAYPLKEIWETFVKNEIPFAGDREYVQLLKLDTNKILDNSYTEAKYKKDLKVVKKTYMEQNQKFLNSKVNFYQRKNAWDEFLDDAEGDAFSDKPVSLLWNVTRLLSKLIIPAGSSKLKEITAWNGILRLLGYDCAIDREGLGFIHRNEPVQAVFFYVRAIKQVDSLLNKTYESNTNKKVGEIQDGSNKIFKIFHPNQSLDVVNKVFQKFPDLAQNIKGFGVKVVISEDKVIFCGGSINCNLHDVTLRDSTTDPLNVEPDSSEQYIYLEDCIITGGTYSKVRMRRCRITNGYFEKVSLKDSNVLGGTFNHSNLRRCSIKNTSFYTLPKYIDSCEFISGTIYDNILDTWFKVRIPLEDAFKMLESLHRRGHSFMLRNANKIQQRLLKV